MFTKEIIYEALKNHFGFEAFKDNQEHIISSLLHGKDTFVIMPTGGGKSLCYQLPALMLPGTAIIISPLIALMKNQVDSIRAVSYTHLRAHETVLDLVCRLLLDKKKNTQHTQHTHNTHNKHATDRQ